MDNVLTPNPGANTDVNNDNFDSPFIESISEGFGWYVGVTMEVPMWWDLRGKYSIGYKKKNIDVVARPNPPVTGGPIDYDQLTTEEYAQEYDFMYFNAIFKHEGIKTGSLLWQPGINIGFDYLSNPYEQEFQSAPSKLAVYTVETGYDHFEMYYGGRLDVSINAFTFGVVANFTRYGLEPALTTGMQF